MQSVPADAATAAAPLLDNHPGSKREVAAKHLASNPKATGWRRQSIRKDALTGREDKQAEKGDAIGGQPPCNRIDSRKQPVTNKKAAEEHPKGSQN